MRVTSSEMMMVTARTALELSSSASSSDSESSPSTTCR